MSGELLAELPTAIITGRSAVNALAEGRSVMLSGASDGADTLFGALALGCGHLVAHLLGPHNVPSAAARAGQQEALCHLDDGILHSELVDEVVDAIRRARYPNYASLAAFDRDWRKSRRNVLQVLCADAVYAVAYRAPSAGDSQTAACDVGGGTGYACQCYINRFQPLGPEAAASCRLYLYDDGAPEWAGCLKDARTHRRWSAWDPASQAWAPLDGPPPRPEGVYAGIGSTRLHPDFGDAAIRALMAPV